MSVSRSSVCRAVVTALAVVATLAGLVVVPAWADPPAPTVTYTNTQTIPVPPASSYAGSGGGDGWGLAFSDTEVYNVFHHQGTLQVACHLQSDASACYDPVTLQDASHTTSVRPGTPACTWTAAPAALGLRHPD